MSNPPPNPRRLLLTADTLGGVWTYALELAAALAPHGVEVALATMGAPTTRDQRAAVAALGNVELFEGRHRLEWMDAPWADVDRAGQWLLGLAAALRPDVVHLNGYAHGALPWPAPVLVAAHSCVLSWWTAVKNEDAPPLYDTYRRRVRAGLEAADVIVAPTAAMLDTLGENYGVRPSSPRCRVIANARDPRGYHSAPAKRPCVLSAGRLWDEAKNFATLDSVAPRVSWPIHVAGSNAHPDGSRMQFEHVHCLGHLAPDSLAQELSAAAIYVSPTRYEPFGLTALEAGLGGCVLVLGDLASLREVWGHAAVFVGPDDPNELVRTLNELVADPVRRARLGQRARTRALEFSPRRMAGDYLEAYRACLSQHAAKEAVAA